MSGLGAAALDAQGPAFTNEQSCRSSVSANRRVIGTLSALARASSVPSDGGCSHFRSLTACPRKCPPPLPVQ